MAIQAQIHKKALSETVEDRRDAVSLLAANFSHFPDRTQAWQDLDRLTQDEDRYVRLGAAGGHGSCLR